MHKTFMSCMMCENLAWRNISALPVCLKGTNIQHSGHVGKIFKTEKTTEIQPVRPTEVCGKYEVRKMSEGLLKHNCHCPMLLKRTTKTAVCLQTKAIFITLWVLIGVRAKFNE